MTKVINFNIPPIVQHVYDDELYDWERVKSAFVADLSAAIAPKKFVQNVE